MVRISISSNGKYVKAKARGKRRKVWKIPFRDELRKRSFETMRNVLGDLGFEGLKEEPFKRGVKIAYEANGEICTRIVHTTDIALSARPPLPLNPFKDSLKGEDRVKFVYGGRGNFKVFLPEDADDDEVGALTKVTEDSVHPLYTTAFAGRLPKPQTRRMVELYSEKLSSEVELGGEEDKIQTIAKEEEEEPLTKETMPDEMKPPETLPAPPPAEITPRLEESELEEKTISVEEMRKDIAEYHPFIFREKAAYERYQRALTRPWAKGSEDKIHMLFHNLISGRRKPEDFEHYYNQLYRLAPELLEARIRPRRRLPSEKTPKRVKMN